MPKNLGSIDFGQFKELITKQIMDVVNGLSEEEKEALIARWEQSDNLDDDTDNDDVWYTNVDSAGNCVLSGCNTKSVNIVLPETIDGMSYEISGGAFRRKNIESITISAGVTLIDRLAFAHCEKLKKVTFEDGFNGTIMSSAFMGCNSLVEFAFPSNITIIEPIVDRCPNLSSVYIPHSVTKISPYAFAANISLKNIYFDGSKNEWALIEKGYRWSCEMGDYTVHCHDGKIVNRKKTQKYTPPKSTSCIVETPISLEEENTEYIYCEVDLGASRNYSYIIEDESIMVGDTVVVPIGTKNVETLGVVDNIIKCTGKNAPFPPSKTKRIIRKYTL